MEESQDRRIIEFDLSDYYPKNIQEFDIAPFLYKGIAVKEKEFRRKLKDFDCSILEGKNVRLFCSVDAIIPAWVFPFVANLIAKKAHFVAIAESSLDFVQQYIAHELSQIEWEKFENKRVLLRGCSDKEIPQESYVLVTLKLSKIAKKLSYGELCSQVPL